jgi:hypothetical protein
MIYFLGSVWDRSSSEQLRFELASIQAYGLAPGFRPCRMRDDVAAIGGRSGAQRDDRFMARLAHQGAELRLDQPRHPE